jgi:hypothetical protein
MKLTWRAAPVALWLASIALGAATVRAVATSVRMDPVPIATVAAAPGVPSLPDRALLQEQADSLRQRNPFRIERSPTSQPYGAPETAAPPQVEVPAQPLPALRVGGIVGGPPWKALIEGIPGRESGLLLAAGEEWNGYRLVWVRGDSVMVITPDTTWILALKKAWR